MLTRMNMKAFITGVMLAVVILLGIFAFGTWYYLKNFVETDREFISPLTKIVQSDKLDLLIGKPGNNSLFKEKSTINVLLIGIDRRNKSQTTFNTDVMLLVSVNPKTNKVLLTSVPRDLWINGNKINALHAIGGPEALVSAFEQITGQEIHAYIRTDFEDFKWIVDAFGGVPVGVQTTFTDNTFPNNSDTGIYSVTFTQGQEVMSGERALVFARSRKALLRPSNNRRANFGQ